MLFAGLVYTKKSVNCGGPPGAWGNTLYNNNMT
jgi:hypothetical protein